MDTSNKVINKKNRYYKGRIKVASNYYMDADVVQRVSRKDWNKAVALIDNGPQKPREFCSRNGCDTRRPSFFRGRPQTLLIEIKQALLRHDWETVHRVHMHLLDVYVSFWRTSCAKIMLTSLLTSPFSNGDIFADFCRMATGIDDDEVKIFLKTMKTLPSEIARGFLKYLKDKYCVKGEDGARLPADAYYKASLPLRNEEEPI